MSVGTRHKSAPAATASKAPAAFPKCPECRGAMNLANVPPPGKPWVCPLCAAVYINDAAHGPRMLLTQEWHDVCCLAGYDGIWDERARVLEKLTAPPKGIMKTVVTSE